MYVNHSQLVPDEVLQRLSREPAPGAQPEPSARDTPEQAEAATLTRHPELLVFDCRQTQSLPGLRIEDPEAAQDAAVQRCAAETAQMLRFLQEAFQRNSIDGAGMTLLSSVHYGRRFNNAMWNGLQAVYGDGDGALFVDFTRGADVIGCVLAHGLTQHTLQLDYAGEAGGLKESLSDCLGAMFRQWRLRHDAAGADWRIGCDAIGPVLQQRGCTCLRDMSDPGGAHCLAPQPAHYAQLQPGLDPHSASGPPNLAFCSACRQLGGYSWEGVGQAWWRVLATAGPAPRLGLAEFAARTRQAAAELFGPASGAVSAVDAGWRNVGL